MSTALGRPVDGLGADRPSRDEHEHDRCARRGDGEDELLLHAGQVERGDVAALARGAVVGEAGTLPHHHDGDVAAGGGVDGGGESGPVVVRDAAALDVHELDARKLRGEGVEDRGDVIDAAGAVDVDAAVDRHGEHVASALQDLEQRLDVGDVRVVTEQVPGARGVRPDHRDRARGGERQHPVVLQQHEAVGGDRAGEISLLG